MTNDAVLRIVTVLRQDDVDRADQEGTEEQCEQQNLEDSIFSRAKMQNQNSPRRFRHISILWETKSLAKLLLNVKSSWG